ncbi:MAG: hypothetical protein PWP11_388 [Thauera sp.]|nr:hypothetical protein [Thauera sp.]MDI3489111.1 hypothetical protein [Thauera sp.]
MSFDARSLFELLPAIHRIRDAELAQQMGDSLLTLAERAERDALAALASPSEDEQQRLAALNEKAARGPLESLIAVFAEQIGAMDENLAQLYDDLFIETCADWVVPYIGDLIGYESLHSVAPKVASPRAEVAHTIALRRRKGTALVLEQLARDVTGWDARAVEYFQRLAATQYMNHPRPHALQSPDLRRGRALEWLGTPFDTSMRTVEVRRIEHGGGRYNIPNFGLHLWRIQAFPHTASPAAHAGVRCYRASPLNHDLPLYNRPLAEDDIGHLAGPENVPWPLSRRCLAVELGRHYGSRPSAGEAVDNPAPALQLWVDGTAIDRDRIRICNLADDGAGWAHTPPPDGVYAIDPQLGRIALPGDAPDPADVRLDWREGFSAELGGGEYERGDSLPTPPGGVHVAHVPAEHATLAAALAEIDGNGVVEIADNRRYAETLAIDVVADGSIEIRAANGFRPMLVVDGLSIRGGNNAACTLNGLLVTGAPLVVPDAGGNALARLTLLHCTLVPGIALAPDATPLQPDTASLRLEPAGLETTLVRSIVGGIRAHPRARFTASDSVIDATGRARVAFAGLDDASPGAELSLAACSVIGKLHTAEVGLIANSILFAARGSGDTWPAPVRAARKQAGCIRFSWLPLDAIVPQRYRCQPASAAEQRISPQFVSRRYGTPAYAQLAVRTPAEIRRGADDEGEMGALHHLYAAQRETNLRIRLAEYLRVGLCAGLFHES